MTSSSMETISTKDGQSFEGYLVRPQGSGPGILLLQEIFGVGDFIKDRANALGELGYTVLCPDLFWRVEKGFSVHHDDEGLSAAFAVAGQFAQIDREVVISDLVAVLDHLRHLVGSNRVCVMGYCLGGRLAYEVAAAAEVDACVSYYGSGIADQLAFADTITCPILFHFGGDDPYIPMDQIDAIATVFSPRANARVCVQYEAGHAFENSFAPMFSNPDATEKSWPITVEFLHLYLKG